MHLLPSIGYAILNDPLFLVGGAQVEQTEVISVRSVGRKRRSGHQNNANIALNAFGRHIRLKLRRNRRLVSRNFMLRNNMEASGYDESSVDIEWVLPNKHIYAHIIQSVNILLLQTPSNKDILYVVVVLHNRKL